MKTRATTGLMVLILIGLFELEVHCQNTVVDNSSRPLRVLVLGDSILWGQGLKEENKSWHHVKEWLAQQTTRRVIEHVEAHSGAVIEAEPVEPNRQTNDSEVNRARPTIMDQLNRASQSLANSKEVEVVFVSGCANDVGARTILNAANSIEHIRRLTEAKCGEPMERLLRRIASSFPAAYIVVTGYYPVITEKSRNDMFMRGLTKKFYEALPGASKMDRKSIFKQVIANSNQWYLSSNRSLEQSVNSVNAELRGSTIQRVRFAGIHLQPEHSFRARQTKLWDFESSPLRKFLVLVSFGKILLRPNDEVRKQRTKSCKEYWKPLTAHESRDEKRHRKNEELLCRYASLGHPNRQGALTYTEAILTELRTLVPVLAKGG